MRARSTNRTTRLHWIMTSTALTLGLAMPPESGGCPVSYDVEEQISIEISPGKSAMLTVFSNTSDTGEADCAAWIEFPLSSFPTSRLAMRPVDIARSMRDIVKKLGAKECDVQVMYENDTQEEIAQHELCLTETFGFGQGVHWSKAREGYCWEPDPIEVEVEVVEVD